ncbi:MAG: hypothetical protein AB2596_20680, partial [Candidatus Thiodiazotropha sp.]
HRTSDRNSKLRFTTKNGGKTGKSAVTAMNLAAYDLDYRSASSGGDHEVITNRSRDFLLWEKESLYLVV